MVKKKAVKKAVVTKEPVVVENPVVVEPSEEEVFVPEEVEAGVMRDEKKESPIEQLLNTEAVRMEGNWVKKSLPEIAKLEAQGLLLGYDPKTSEVLIKEK